MKSSQTTALSDTEVSTAESTLELPDGRTLSYAEHGDTDGTPVFFFHGTPGARTCVPDPTAVVDNRVHFITTDRPGYGGSTPNPDATLTDWIDDVVRVADMLDIDRFAVAGLSGGGPYALACGAVLPDRVTRVGVISGMAPLNAPGSTDGMSLYNRLGFTIARYVPALLPLALRSMARQAQADPESVIEEVRPRYTATDQLLMDDPDTRNAMARELSVAFDQGVRGMVDDFVTLAHSWDFELNDVSVPVRLWHGGEDRNVPLPMAEYLTEMIPRTHLTIFPEEGHLIAYEHFDEILSELIK